MGEKSDTNNTNALAAKEQKPEISEQPQVEEQPFDIEEIRKSIPKAFRGYLDPVVAWGQKVEARLKAHEAAFAQLSRDLPAEIQRRFEATLRSAAVQASRTSAESSVNRGSPSLPAANQSDIGQLLGMLNQMGGLGGAPASNPYMDKLMANAIEQSNLGNALVKAVIMKVAPEVAAGLIDEAKLKAPLITPSQPQKT